MENQSNKYKITDKEGVNLFIDSLKTSPEKTKKKSDEEAARLKKKRIRLFVGISSLIILFVISLSVVMYNVVTNYRSKELQINMITEAVINYEQQMRLGKANVSYFEANMKTADSLINVIDNLISKYPETDTLKFLWTSITLHKYERYINYSLKSNIYDNIADLDSNTLNIAAQYNPQMLTTLKIMKAIPEFYKFKKLFPNPPVLSKIAPQQYLIDELKDKASEIESLLKNNAVLIEVHFPVLYSWIKFISNSVIPDIFEWVDFWKKYEQAIAPNNSAIHSEGIFSELRRQYPDLEVLKTFSSLSLDEAVSFSIGISASTALPHNRNIISEWKPIIEYLEQKYGYKIRLEIYETYNDLYTSFRNSEIDYALLDISNSALAYYSNIGKPFVLRVWNEKSFVSNYLITTDKNIKNINDLKDAEIAYTGSNYYALLEHFENSKYNTGSKISNFKLYNNLDSLYNALQKGEVTAAILNEEEKYYISILDSTINDAKILVNLENSPLNIFWVREGFSAEAAEKFKGIIIPLLPSTLYQTGNPNKDYPFADWNIYDETTMHKYLFDTKQTLTKYNIFPNKLHLLPVKYDDVAKSEEIQNSLKEFLSKEGFVVISHTKESIFDIADSVNHIISLEASESDKNSISYDMKIRKELGKEHKIVYHDHFVSPRDTAVDFRFVLFDIAEYVLLRGKVSNIKGNQVYIDIAIDSFDFTGKMIYLYKTDIYGNKKGNPYLTKKIESEKGSLVIFSASNSELRLIELGDLGEIANE